MRIVSSPTLVYASDSDIVSEVADIPDGVSVHRVNLTWNHIGDSFWRASLTLPSRLCPPGGGLIPCLSAKRVSCQFALCADAYGSADPVPEWMAAFAPIGAMHFPRLYAMRTSDRSASRVARIETDIARVLRQTDRMRLEVTVYDPSQRWPAVPHLLTVSCSRSAGKQRHRRPWAASAQLEVVMSPVSQYEIRHERCGEMCSPASVAMVLRSHNVDADVADVARHARMPDIEPEYGVWPANVWAAAQYGCRGYVLQFPDWRAAASLLECGMPIVASIRYQKGALENAPAPETPYGHMVVLAGYTPDGRVIVYDPAAPDAGTVRRLYDWGQFCDAWFNHHGVGYVIMPPA